MLDTILLTEYETRRLPAAELTPAEGRRLWRQFGAQLEVGFPSPRTAEAWELTARGWVGLLPLSRTRQLELRPRVPLARWLEWLAIAGDFGRWRLPPGVIAAATLTGFYDQIAAWLAERVLARARQGLARSYRPVRADLPFVRGRLDVARVLSRPEPLVLPCTYQEHTAATADNEILLWTLQYVARGGRCAPPVQRRLRQAVHVLSSVGLHPWTAQAVGARVRDGRAYGRLNDDYRALHALCHFLLDHTGPRLESGDRPAAPFLVDSAALFERAVARWLQGADRPVRDQEPHLLDPVTRLRFVIDLVLYDERGHARCVLDTKYKSPGRAPGAADVAQVVAYAAARACRLAVLVYPRPLAAPFQVQVGEVTVAALAFDMGRPPEAAGRAFLAALDPLLS